MSASLVAAIGDPTAAVCPPGNCVLKADEWTPAALLERTQLTHDSYLITFGLADESKPLGLPTCACLLAMFDDAGSAVVRPYTPVSTNALIGKFQLVIKVYPEGKMSQYMLRLPIGEKLSFKHIDKNVKIQYPFGKQTITMLAGGTAITPMIQAIHAILGTTGDETKIVLLLGNKTQQDFLCKDLLDEWENKFASRLKVIHVLSGVADDDTWTGAKGFIDRKLLEEYCPPPQSDNEIFICGPPPMYDALCGPRDKPEELTGLLNEMGYQADEVYKF